MDKRRDLFFEDFNEGDAFETAGCTVTEGQIVDFAMKYDPQPFHMDVSAAEKSAFKGLIASGVHTLAITLRVMLAEQIFNASSMGSPGLEEVRWYRPVRPGTSLRAKMTVKSKRESSKAPDRGYVEFVTSALDQNDQEVMMMRSVQIIRKRDVAG